MLQESFEKSLNSAKFRGIVWGVYYAERTVRLTFEILIRT